MQGGTAPGDPANRPAQRRPLGGAGRGCPQGGRATAPADTGPDAARGPNPGRQRVRLPLLTEAQTQGRSGHKNTDF